MDIRIKRNELLKESKLLRGSYFGVENKNKRKQYAKAKQMREKQNQIYKQWKFYDKFIKSMEEIK